MKYFKNSCYQDSVLLSLLAIPNKFIDEKILNKDIKDVVSKRNQIYKCSESIEEDITRRTDIQKELISIMNIVRNPNDEDKDQTCSRLRELIRKCPSIGGQEFHNKSMQDAGEFLTYLFLLFGIENTRKQTITNKYTNNIFEKEETLTDFITSVRKTVSSPVVLIPPDGLKENASIGNYLIYKENSIMDQENLAKAPNGEYYNRLIVTNKIEDADYLVFYIQRKQLQTDGKIIVLETKIIPNRFISLNKKKTLYLHAIVTYKSSHYTCYIKCKKKWYYYNDMSNDILYIGDYDELINKSEERSYPDPTTMGVLYFYSLNN